MKYFIIKDRSTYELEVKVNKAFAEGLKPVGGVAVAFDSKDGVFGTTYYCQAVVCLEPHEGL